MSLRPAVVAAASTLAVGVGALTMPSAASEDCGPYVIHCEQSEVRMVASSPNAGQRLWAKVKVSEPGPEPDGVFRLIVRRASGNGLIAKRSKPLNETGAATLSTPKLQAGTIRVVLRFIPSSDSDLESVTRKYRLKVS